MLDIYKKPRVGQVTDWVVLFGSDAVEVAVAGNHPYFYRVRPAGGRPKYHYGESAYHKARAEAADLDFQAWGI
jgi:hypothetical protein